MTRSLFLVALVYSYELPLAITLRFCPEDFPLFSRVYRDQLPMNISTEVLACEKQNGLRDRFRRDGFAQGHGPLSIGVILIWILFTFFFESGRINWSRGNG